LHLDIKPDNVLLAIDVFGQESNLLYLIDFGISKFIKKIKNGKIDPPLD
jgi:serine/threonine protein kinase